MSCEYPSIFEFLWRGANTIFSGASNVAKDWEDREVRGRIETTSLVGFNRGKIDGIT